MRWAWWEDRAKHHEGARPDGEQVPWVQPSPVFLLATARNDEFLQALAFSFIKSALFSASQGGQKHQNSGWKWAVPLPVYTDLEMGFWIQTDWAHSASVTGSVILSLVQGAY